ncbi:MAG: hypothetical protein ACK56I_01280, partial [bacterium]
NKRQHCPVHRPRIRREPNIQLDQRRAPLLHQQLQPVPAAAAHAAARHVQVLQVPEGKPHQRRVGDALAAADVEQAQPARLLQDALDLAVVHAVEVAALVHAYRE